MKGAIPLLQHFNYKPMYAKGALPGWTFSFFYQQQRYTGDYMPDGSIIWTSETPPQEESVKKMVHELMTFHVYE